MDLQLRKIENQYNSDRSMLNLKSLVVSSERVNESLFFISNDGESVHLCFPKLEKDEFIIDSYMIGEINRDFEEFDWFIELANDSQDYIDKYGLATRNLTVSQLRLRLYELDIFNPYAISMIYDADGVTLVNELRKNILLREWGVAGFAKEIDYRKAKEETRLYFGDYFFIDKNINYKEIHEPDNFFKLYIGEPKYPHDIDLRDNS